MKLKYKLSLILLILLTLFLFIGAVSAESNMTDTVTVSNDVVNINDSTNPVTNIDNSSYQSENGVNAVNDNGINTKQATNSIDDVSTSKLSDSLSWTYYISPDGTGNGLTPENPTNWTTAYNLSSNGGTIYFTSGTYTNIVNKTITKDLTLSAYNNAQVIIDAQRKGYVFTGDFSIKNNTINIQGITFTHGNGLFLSGVAYFGGVISHIYYLNIKNSTFINNGMSNGSGGAIYAVNVNIDNCTFNNNYIDTRGDGGAIHANFITVNNSYFKSNTAGKGIIDGNIDYQGSGGAICGNCNVSNSIFQNNEANDGGALYGNCNIDNTSFIGNFADNEGGAIYGLGSTNITNSILDGNHANYGGAIHANLDITINGSVILDNKADSFGKAILYSGILNADYNWWGDSNPFRYANYSNLICYRSYTKGDSFVTPNNWAILDLNANPISIYLKQNATITASLNSYKTMDNSTGLIPTSITIPERNITYTTGYIYGVDCGSFNPTSGTILGTTTTTYIPPSNVGNYTIIASVDNDKSYLNIKVKITPTQINGTNLNLIYNSSGYFKILLTDLYGNPLNGETVNITLNNKKYSETTLTGETGLIISNLPIGNYTIYYTFIGDSNYKPSSGSNNISVTNLIDTTISGNDLSMGVGESKTYSVTLKDINGNLLNNQQVKFIYMANTVYATTVNGVATITISGLNTAGTIPITYNFEGSNQYLPSNGTSAITVTSYTPPTPTTISTEISGSDMKIYYGTSGIFIAILKDNNGNLLSGKTVTFTLNGETKTNTTVDGIAKLRITDLNVGTYTVTYNFAKSGNYLASSGSNTITVLSDSSKINTIITGTDINIVEGNNATFTATLKDSNGSLLNGKLVTFFINGKTYTSNTINGLSTITLTNLKAGTYAITYTFNGDDNYTGSSNENTVIVTAPGIAPGIYGNNLTEVYGTHQNYTGKLIDINGNPMIGQHVALKLSRSNGQSKVYWVTTDTNGEYQLEINLSPGAYTAEASYGNYSCTNSITVTKEGENRTGVVLTADKFSQPYGAGANFTGTLKDTSGNLLIGQHIAVNLTRLSNGASKIYWVTTDTDGAFQLQINLGLGEYTAQCSYGGTTKYQPASAGNTISVTNP